MNEAPQSSQSPGGLGEREMLEAAAKAARIEIVRSRLDDPMHRDMLIVNSPRNVGQKTGPWNPRVDDSDALRLAVTLRLSIIHEQDYMGGPVLETVEVIGPMRADGSRHCETVSINDAGDDPMANVRLAITRAAAAMASERGRG